MTKRILLIFLIICLSPLIGDAQMTNTVDARPTAYWWTGTPMKDVGLLFLREVETQIEAWTLDGGTTLTFPTNGATIDNATDTEITFTEDDGSGDEDITWDFNDNAILVKSSTGVILFDFQAITLKTDEILLDPISVGTTAKGTLYYDTDDDTLKYYTTSWQSLTTTAGSPAGSNTQIQYNDGGSFGGIAGFIWDDTNVEIADAATARLAIGADADWLIGYEETDDDTLSIQTAKIASQDPDIGMLTIAVDTGNSGLTANQEVFEIGKGAKDDSLGNFVELFAVDADGDVTVAGSLTVGTTFYQTAIASAATGVVNLTVDASESGNITIGGISTGATLFPRDVDFTGDTVDIGDLATNDTLSILAKIDTDVLIDDDTGDSPALVIRDGGENDWQFVKKNGATANLEVTSDSATSDFHIVTGNLKVGGGSEGVTLNGEDAYITGTLEVDSAVQFDGTTTLNGEVSINEQILVTLNAADEEMIITNSAEYSAEGAQVTIENTDADVSANMYLLRLIYTDDGQANADFFICDDNNGDEKFRIGGGGTSVWTLDATGFVKIDATTTANSTTLGGLDVDFETATNTGKAIAVELEVKDGATLCYGVYTNINDGSSGAEVAHAFSALNATGTNAITKGFYAANTLDDCFEAVVGAANQALVIDAFSAVQTQTDGVIDISHSSATNATSVINIAHTVGDLGSAEVSTAILIDTVDNTSSNAAFVRGVAITSSDIAGHANTINQAFYTSGLDCALQADNGYIRVGTGSTPTITPGDDDIYAEGTIEADGGLSLGTSLLQCATIDLTAADIRALAATPIELVAAPSAGEVLEFVSALLILDQGTSVFTEAGGNDNLAIEYDGGAAVAASETIEMTGFIDQNADMITRAIPVKDPFDAALDIVAKNLVLVGLDDEIGGNAENDSALRVIITYRVISALGL